MALPRLTQTLVFIQDLQQLRLDVLPADVLDEFLDLLDARRVVGDTALEHDQQERLPTRDRQAYSRRQLPSRRLRVGPTQMASGIRQLPSDLIAAA